MKVVYLRGLLCDDVEESGLVLGYWSNDEPGGCHD